MRGQKLLLEFYIRNGKTAQAGAMETQMFMNNVTDREIDAVIYQNRAIGSERRKPRGKFMAGRQLRHSPPQIEVWYRGKSAFQS
jgi:hypothetical protein